MKNITFSADEKLIEEARSVARDRKTTLNDEFRRWLAGYAGREARVKMAMQTIDDIRKVVQLKGPFTRDELNERR